MHILHFSIFWVMEHFAHTAFLLSQTIMLYFHVFLDKQRVLMFTNYNPYQNIFQMTLKFSPYSWWYCAVDAFRTCCVLVKLFFPENPLFKNLFFKNHFYHLIEHTSKYLFMQKGKWPKCHVLQFYYTDIFYLCLSWIDLSVGPIQNLRFYFTEQLKQIVLH